MTKREKLPDWVQELIAEHNDKGEPLDPNNPAEMYEACLYWFDAYIEIAEDEDRKTFTMSDELKQFIAYTEALATAAEINGLDSTLLVEFLREMEGFYYGIKKRMPATGKSVQTLVDRLKFKLDGIATKTPTVVPTPSPVGDHPTASEEKNGVEDKPRSKELDEAISPNMLIIDEPTFSIRIGNKSCEVGNKKGFHAFKRLVLTPGQHVHYRHLIDDVWQDEEVEKSAVQKAISNLRAALKGAGITEIQIDGKQPDHYLIRLNNIPLTRNDVKIISAS